MDGTMDSANSYYVFPTAIVLGVLSAATIALDILPFVWHFRNRNIAACSLIFWILVLNLCSLINVFLWPNDNTKSWPDGRGLCDVEAKIFVGSFVALTGALLCIMRSLARVMDTEHTVVAPTRAQRRRAVALDLFFCFGLPLYTMVVHYVVQPNRYYLWGISGCSASVDNSWVFIVLIVLPPLLLSLADAYYSGKYPPSASPSILPTSIIWSIPLTNYTGLVIFRLHRYRLQFSRLLTASNTTKSRFMRLFIMSQILIFAFVPIQVYIFYLNMQLPLLPYSWNEVHSAAAWAQIVMIPSFGTVLFDRWIRVVCGFLVFVFFGVGADAVLMYKSWLLALGCGRIFPGLKREGSGRFSPKHSLGSWGEKAKLVLSGKRHRGAASSRTLAKTSVTESFDSFFASSSISASTLRTPNKSFPRTTSFFTSSERLGRASNGIFGTSTSQWKPFSFRSVDRTTAPSSRAVPLDRVVTLHESTVMSDVSVGEISPSVVKSARSVDVAVRKEVGQSSENVDLEKGGR
ncbi:hypothetical protein B0A49_00045 [Cryomyces minteri]|uniref:Uncharacterized protein n=1 Tax=Cryomyces minteri TaxID=331657 RepID=A0A4U0Y146_9PEZI|nr:hypothetical protein B0A49_00045 [Cryomyces minteri]